MVIFHKVYAIYSAPYRLPVLVELFRVSIPAVPAVVPRVGVFVVPQMGSGFLMPPYAFWMAFIVSPMLLSCFYGADIYT
jgi:hypothetical protein